MSKIRNMYVWGKIISEIQKKSIIFRVNFLLNVRTFKLELILFPEK